MKALDITGQRFGKLVALARHGHFQSPSRKHVLWLCACDCGNQAVIRLNSLRGGIARSCGCLRGKKSFKHGLIYTAEYHSWSSMKDRCSNPNNKSFMAYGGRGIKVCESWADSFEQFYADMGARPTPAHSIDRIDVNGNYEPGNCRWSTNYEQARNKRTNRFIEFNGIRKTLSDWASDIGIDPTSLHERLQKYPIEIALTTPRRR